MRLFNGIVKTGIGGAAVEMAKPGGLEDWKRLTGLEVIPGTLNLQLEEPFDLSLLKYFSFSELGWDFDPASQGHDFSGEVGMYIGRITIEGKYPGILAFWTWSLKSKTHAELISPVQMRNTLGLKDGDWITFSLFSDDK